MHHVERVLYDLLDDAGVRLVETRKLPDFLNACFHKSSRTIYVSSVIDSATRVSAIAHELGHAHFDHDCSTSRAEREADEWAALHLLDAHMVEEAARECDFAPSLIASELGITPHLLATWMQLYHAGRINSYIPCTTS